MPKTNPERGAKAMRNKKMVRIWAMIAALSLCAVGVQAQVDGSWNVDAAGNWSDADNWDSDPSVPGGAGATVGLTNAISANRTVTIDTDSRTVGTLNIGLDGNTRIWTLASSGGASLTFDNSASGAALNVIDGPGGNAYPIQNVHEISAPIALADNLTVAVAMPLRVSGIISESGGTRSMTLNSGDFMLFAHNTFTGGVTVNGGTLGFTSDGKDASDVVQSIGSGTLTVGGGTLGFHHSNTHIITNHVVLNANFGVYRGQTGTTTWQQDGNITLGGNVRASSPNATMNWVVNGSIGETGGSRSLEIHNNTLHTSLNAANTFSGGFIHSASGTLNINHEKALGTGSLTIPAARNINNTSGGPIALVNTNNVILQNTMTFVGSDDLNMGPGSVTLSGGNRTVSVTAGTLTFDGPVVPDATASRTLTKTGAGTLLLNGENTYTGQTSVNAGTLGGSGTIAGNVTVAAAGNLAPGATNTVGTLTIDGNLTISAISGESGKLFFELDGEETSDKIVVGGDLTIDGLGWDDFDFTALAGFEEGIYTLITSDRIIGGLDIGNVTGTIGEYSGTLEKSGEDIVLLVGVELQGQDGTWNAQSGNWGTEGNWLGSNIANGADYTAWFTSDITDDRTVTLDAARTIGHITFTDAVESHDLTISGGNTLTLAVDSDAPTIDVTQRERTLTIGSVVAGDDGLLKTGPGTLALSAANTFTGTTSISGGALVVDANGGSGSLEENALTFGGTGVLNYLGAGSGSDLSLGTLTFASGQGTVQSTYGSSGNTSVTFGSLAARTAGAVGDFHVSGGSNGTNNAIVLTGQAAGLIDRGVYFNSGDFAYYDGDGFVRAPVYDTDADFETRAGASTLGIVDDTIHVEITGNITAQTTAEIATLKIGGAHTLRLEEDQTLTLNGIIKSGGGSGFIVGKTQNTDSIFVSGGGSEITIRTATASDTFSFAQIGSNNHRYISITNAAGMTISGPGRVNMRVISNDSTGQVTISGGGTVLFNNGGTVATTTGTSFGTGNIKIDGGVLEGYWQGTIRNHLGTGNNQLQIVGGVSGFSANNTWNVILDNDASSEVVWGSAFFNPSTLVLQAATAGPHSLTFQNRIDLNGADRIVGNFSTEDARATMSGIIRNTSGAPAGLIKTGPGRITLSANGNTYNGGTTINEGTLHFQRRTAMPGDGAVTVNDGAILRINLGDSNGWNTGTSGAGSLGGLLDGTAGGQAGGTLVYNGNVGLSLNVAGTSIYTGDIEDVGDSLAIHKIGSHALTLSGNNSYSGGTFMEAGTLYVNGENTTTGETRVNGGRLGGTGTIGGDVIVAAVGNLEPGSGGVGLLTINGNLDISAISGGAGNLFFELGNPEADPYDQIVVNGTLTIDGLSFDDFDFNTESGIFAGEYTLIESDNLVGELAGGGTYLEGSIGSVAAYLEIKDNNLVLVIPELNRPTVFRFR